MVKQMGPVMTNFEKELLIGMIRKRCKSESVFSAKAKFDRPTEECLHSAPIEGISESLPSRSSVGQLR